MIPHPVLYHPSVTILIRGDRYFSPWTHIKSCKVWNDENKFVISQNISSTQVLLWRYLHIYTIHYCTIRIMYYTQVMQLKVKLEMHLNAGMNASLLLISNSYFKALYLYRCSSFGFEESIDILLLIHFLKIHPYHHCSFLQKNIYTGEVLLETFSTSLFPLTWLQ